MATKRSTRRTAPLVSMQGLLNKADSDTPLTVRRRSERRKPVLRTRTSQEPHEASVPNKTPQTVYEFNETDVKSDRKVSKTTSNDRKRKPNQGKSGEPSKKKKLTKSKSKLKEISPILPNPRNQSHASSYRGKSRKRGCSSPDTGGPTKKKGISSIQVSDQIQFSNPLLGEMGTNDSLDSPYLALARKKRQKQVKTSTPASAVDGPRTATRSSMESLNVMEASLSGTSPVADESDSGSGLFSDYSSAYTVSHLSLEEDKAETEVHEPAKDEPDLIADKSACVPYKPRTKRPKGRYSVGKLDAWAEKMNAEFAEVEKFELSIENDG